MGITVEKGLWVANYPYADRHVPKDAGFWWHGGGKWCDNGKCVACKAGLPLKKWYTAKPECAARLAHDADEKATALLSGHTKTVEASKAADSDIDVPSPEGLEYRPFQRGGIAYAMARKNTLLGDEMGCIDGNAVITINRGGGSRKYKLSDAYKRFNGLDKTKNNWNQSIPTYTRSLCDGELRLSIIKKILDKEIKPVVLLTLDSGKTLRLTDDHEIATEDGSWVEAKNLVAGQMVLTNGQPVCPTCGSIANLATYKYSKFRGYCRTCIYRKKRKNTTKEGKFIDSDGYIRVSGMQEHHRAGRGGFVYEHILAMESILGRSVSWPSQIHHKNGNRSDNRPENLEIVTSSEHHRKHKKHLHFPIFSPKLDRVVSVKADGKAHVYDIVMSSDYRNFVANGVVVHNCGKTIQALGVVNASPEAKSVLCIVPASLRLNWRKEAERWLVRRKDFSIYVVEKGTERVKTGEKVEKTVKHRDGTTTTKLVDETVSRPIGIPEYANFVIVNYDLLSGRNVTNPNYDPKDKDSSPKVWKPSHMLAQLMARTWDILIVDEAHYIKNPKAARTKAVIGSPGNKRKKINPINGLTSRSDRKMFLTGTPILNRPVEMQPLLAALAPNEFGNFFMFAKRYCAATKGRWGWDFSGSSNLAELQEKLRSSVMLRRLKRDVLKELPAKQRQVICLPLNGAKKAVEHEARAYEAHGAQLDELRNQMDFAHASGDKNAYKAAVAALRDAQKVAFEEMSVVRQEVAIAKIPKVIEHIENAFESGTDKIVVFGHHRAVCNAIFNHFGDIAVRLTGEDTKLADRQASVDRFQSDPTIKLFVGSIKAAGVGFTLTAASHVIFAELDWVPANVTQAEDRLHRIGQEDSVYVQHLVLDGSMDSRMAQVLVEKQDIADKALDKNTLVSVPVTPSKNPRNHRPNKYPEVSPERRTAALTAMQVLAGVCDGASTKDGAGFNRLDTSIGHKLAALSELSDGQTWLAATFARKYQRQLGDEILVALGIREF